MGKFNNHHSERTVSPRPSLRIPQYRAGAPAPLAALVARRRLSAAKTARSDKGSRHCEPPFAVGITRALPNVALVFALIQPRCRPTWPPDVAARRGPPAELHGVRPRRASAAGVRSAGIQRPLWVAPAQRPAMITKAPVMRELWLAMGTRRLRDHGLTLAEYPIGVFSSWLERFPCRAAAREAGCRDCPSPCGLQPKCDFSTDCPLG